MFVVVKMKGSELPINTVIFIVVGVIVLLAVVGLLLGAFNPSSQSLNLQAATKATCTKINPSFCSDPSTAQKIPVENFDANKNGNVNENPDNFTAICYYFYSGPVTWDNPTGTVRPEFKNVCLVRVCGCPG